MGQNNKIESLTESLKEKNNELRISVEELSSIKEEMRNGNDKAVIISNRMEDCIEDKKKFGQKIVSLEEALGRAEIELKKEKKYHATEVEDINSSMIKQGKLELGKETWAHIEEINKLEQHLKSITVEKDDSESRLSLLQLELNQINNKYDDEKYVQNNKIESLTESLKEKNNELRISVEELSSIKEEMRNGNDKAVIISNRMDDCIEDKKKFGQKIVSLEEALGRAEIELKKEKKYHATEVEDINSS